MIKNIFRTSLFCKHKVSICCIVKNEEKYLIEWLEYHLKIGVDHFYIYDNESEIKVSEYLAQYINKGIVTVELIMGQQQQLIAYDKCLKQHGHSTKWLAYIDIDEYIVIKDKSKNIAEFLSSYNKFGGLGVYWLTFGSNGHITKPEGLQVNNFTRRSSESYGPNKHIKSIVQPKHVSKANHNPHFVIYRKKMFCVDENFQRIDGDTGEHTSAKIHINHYFLRSLEEFKVKVQRGRADVDQLRRFEEFYEFDRECNVIVDTSIANHNLDQLV